MKKLGIVLGVVVLFGVFGSCILLFSDSKKDENPTTIKEETSIKAEDTVESAKLTLAGDLLFETRFYEAVENVDDPNLYFQFVQDYFSDDDLSIGNMEVVIGDENMPVKGGDHYNFSAPMWVGNLVSSLDFEVLSTANNHAYDQGSEGVFSTIDYFKNHSDILTVGTFKSKEDTDQLSILEINGIKFGFLAYTMGTNVKMPSENEYMVSLYKSNYSTQVTEEDKLRLKEEIEKLKEQADVTILLMHWGSEYTFTPTQTQRELAQFFNQLGVDIVVGNHSHNIQPIEWIGEDHKTLVYYSLGNFVSADEDIPRTNLTFNNAYQIGLLSQLIITKENDEIQIHDITTEPIINYYDQNLQNFQLVPYHLYTTDLEINHYRYHQGFNKDFIINTYEQVIPEEIRSV